ncbi:hypothetical protein ACFL9U_15085, partial [Thermodesulfobacteriota bacterium]
TLIEIIAVIIIIGILAAVAVPKFFSMQEDAKKAALQGALAEAQARFNHAYAKYILTEKKAPSAITDLTVAAYLGADGAMISISVKPCSFFNTFFFSIVFSPFPFFRCASFCTVFGFCICMFGANVIFFEERI